MFAPHPFVEVPDSKDGEYLTDRLTLEAEKFIETNRERPFFLYLPYYAIHTPHQAKPELIAGYSDRHDPSGRNDDVYAAMTEGVDQSVGRIVSKLEELGLSSDTVIFFFSDNGGVPQYAFNGNLRSGKGYLWEGGVREPLIVKWPGVIPPASVDHTPVTSVDFYPTILELTRAEDIAGHTVDGVSLTPLLMQSGALDRDAIYWHYPHYANSGSTPTGSIRQGDWKLMEFFEDSHVELYNLAEDEAETTDRAAERPDLAESLRAKLAAWRASVGAKPAPPNPDYDPARAGEGHGLSYYPVWNETDPIKND
jgi:arylsulfatase A-like enzyme